MAERIFDEKNIILMKIEEKDLNAFLLDMDINGDGSPHYPLEDFASCIMNVIPEYVFADYPGTDFSKTNAVSRMREAAKHIYEIKDGNILFDCYVREDPEAQEKVKNLPEYKRGEFGELLLHLLLRKFKGTIPLISKVYFKDSYSVPAHGFDIVHVSPEEQILWLGESKFYASGQRGVKALADDVEAHFLNRDFFNAQFLIIKKNLEANNIPHREEWIKLLSKCEKIKDAVKVINVPLLCTYESDIYEKFQQISEEKAFNYYEDNIKKLKDIFDKKCKKSRFNIILFLFPVRDKLELLCRLHKKLWAFQII